MTQKQKILHRLKQGPADSIELNKICFRYGGRIHELKKEGIDIRSRRIKQGVWQYWISETILNVNVRSLIEKQEKRIEEENKNKQSAMF